MKSFLYCLLFCAIGNAAWADVEIKFKDLTGATSTISSNGQKVRIDDGTMPGFVLVDSASGEFFVVDSQRKEIIKAIPSEIVAVEAAGGLNVSLKSRGANENIAGYSTGRFDLIANGLYCGSVYGSSELMQNRDMRRMFEAMQGMHKLSRTMAAGMGRLLSECQRASTRMADLVDTGGFILRMIDARGKLMFEVLALDTDKQFANNHYELPPGMKVVDIDDIMLRGKKQGQKMMHQMPDMNQMMEQMQQNGGQMTPEMQQQMQQMMEQMQQLQAE